ncbi:hypothetical protein QTP86_017490 [Hemibagrus guttatus]|nr:hypothetical protein QTP86_017490 [Hemibagrus guttatus]
MGVVVLKLMYCSPAAFCTSGSQAGSRGRGKNGVHFEERSQAAASVLETELTFTVCGYKTHTMSSSSHHTLSEGEEHGRPQQLCSGDVAVQTAVARISTV